MSTCNALTTAVSNVGFSNDQFLHNNSLSQITCYTSCLTQSELSLLTAPPYVLTLSVDTLLNPIPKQRRTRFKQDLPPRPQNSWVLFRKDFECQLRAQHPDVMYTLHEISAIAGVQWKNQPTAVKQYFRVLSKLALHRHNIMYPDYTYRPRKSKRARRPRRSKALFKNLNQDTFMDHSSSSSNDNEPDVEQYTDLQLETNEGLYIRDISGDFYINDNVPTDTWFENDAGLYCTYFIQQNISIDFHPYYSI
ncbi:9730_t:CDS:2 [Paraglomus occultum]|uniref:9730_t:CDS:1 n=1 Tax=Paraglomus occultum TaxID=144539 RepID=A0A9N9D8G5_9GLOM|nr:9730_t:CDS:2 [Paraglomus occultum]